MTGGGGGSKEENKREQRVWGFVVPWGTGETGASWKSTPIREVERCMFVESGVKKLCVGV